MLEWLTNTQELDSLELVKLQLWWLTNAKESWAIHQSAVLLRFLLSSEIHSVQGWRIQAMLRLANAYKLGLYSGRIDSAKHAFAHCRGSAKVLFRRHSRRPGRGRVVQQLSRGTPAILFHHRLLQSRELLQSSSALSFHIFHYFRGSQKEAWSSWQRGSVILDLQSEAK